MWLEAAEVVIVKELVLPRGYRELSVAGGLTEGSGEGGFSVPVGEAGWGTRSGPKGLLAVLWVYLQGRLIIMAFFHSSDSFLIRFAEFKL